mgnify:CR=1 FL=1
MINRSVGRDSSASLKTGAFGTVVSVVTLVLVHILNSQPAGAEEAEQVTLVIGGDLGLGGSGQRVDERGARRHGKLHPWDKLTKGLAGLVDGDLNFANLETIVTSNNSLRPGRKAFTFRSHPAGVRHLVDLGFNVFSTANNHVGDYGARGMRETLSELDKLRAHGLLAFPGLGATRKDAGGPATVEAKGRRLSFSAIGIGGWKPSKSSPGILGYYAKQDFNEAVDLLHLETAHYRVLSVHYNIELDVRPSRQDIRKLRDHAVGKKGIDLVIGHHAHVPAGIQEINGRLIFYGLGNLLHPGMQNMSRFGPCRDYGLLAKIHLASNETGALSARAVEVWPLERMHLKARPMTGKKAKRRIRVLNKLAEELDHKKTGAKGIRFLVREDGSGLACFPGAATAGGRIGELCRDWDATTVGSQPSRSVSCARRKYVRSSRGKPKAKRRRASSTPSVLEQVFGWQ